MIFHDWLLTTKEILMEEILLGQIRGLMIMARAANARNDVRAYFHYLARANTMLKMIEANRSFCEQRAA